MTSKSQPKTWDTVYTVNDYFDGPRLGVANLDGIPHVYSCDWDSAADDWHTVFLLMPIEPEDLTLVLEAWSIWRKWKAAHDAGTLGPDDEHPALASDRPRHDEIHPIVTKVLRVDEASAIRAIPTFRGKLEPVHAFEVHWARL